MSLTKEDVSLVFLEGLEAVVLPRFDALDVRIDRMEARLGGRIDGLTQRVNSLERKMDQRFSSVERKLAKVETGLDKIDGRVAGVESDIKELYGMSAR